MSKTNKTEEPKQEKVMTKYDRKMEARKQKEQKDKRDRLISKIVGIAVLVVLVGAIGISIGIGAYNKHRAISGTYVKIGDHAISKLEYDFYYNVMHTNYMNSFSSFLPYMGLDTTKDYASQQYDENKTWQDLFDEMAVGQITETKALLDDAGAKGFVYETQDEDYQTFKEGIELQADNAGVTMSEYYKTAFGEYATEERLKPFITETLLANAYTSKLLEDNKATDEEINTRYEENKQDYDFVDYYMYTFSADVTSESTDEEIEAAMEEARQKADAMVEERMAGKGFQELCDQYGQNTEEDAEQDTQTDTDKNLIQDATYNSIMTEFADWLYDEARKTEDIDVFVNDSAHKVYVVEFVQRTEFNEDTADTISNEIASERVTAYTQELTEKYTVEDVAGKLVYLTKPVSTEDETSAEDDSLQNETGEQSEEDSVDDSTEE